MAWSTNGKGQRSEADRYSSTNSLLSRVQSYYSAQGESTRQDYTLSGLQGTLTYLYIYDRGGRLTSLTYPTGEVASYTYDGAWRQQSLCSNLYSPCYVNSNTDSTTQHYTALDQPTTLSLGNGLQQNYTYTTPMSRLFQLLVGPSGDGRVLAKTYGYDSVGNVNGIGQTVGGQQETQNFTYDHLDRLTSWSTNTGVYETYQYDTVGNITSKAGGTYSYDYTHPAGGGGPYAVRNGGYSYDANGNTLTEQVYAAQRVFTYNYDNQPSGVSLGSVSEQYTYDADGERASRTSAGVTTYHIGALYEEDTPSGSDCTQCQFYGIVTRTGSLRLRQEGNAVDSLAGVVADVHCAIFAEGDVYRAAPIFAVDKPAADHHLRALRHFPGPQR